VNCHVLIFNKLTPTSFQIQRFVSPSSTTKLQGNKTNCGFPSTAEYV
jgi:hypothetical protein